MPTTTIPNLVVDPPIQLTATFRYDVNDRAYIDAQIRGCEQHLFDSGGLNGTQCAWYVVDGSSPTLAVGDIVCLAGTVGSFRNVTKALPTPLAAAGRALGVVMNPAAPGVNVRVAIAGTLPVATTGLTGSANISVRVSSSGRCEQVASFGGTDYPVGFTDAQGNLSLLLLSNPASSGVGGAIAGDVTGTTAASTVVGLTGTTGVVAMHGTGITSDAGQALTIKGANFTTNSGTAPTFIVQAPNATGTTSTGGDLTLTTGSGTSGAGTLRLQVGGGTVLACSAQFSVLLALWAYNSAISAPTIRQDANNASSITGQPFTIQAQNATGTTSTGGDLVLTSGTGTTTAGSVKVQAGGTTKIQANTTGLGFFGTTPAGRQTYTTSNHTDSRTLNETGATLVQVANVVGTIIKDMQSLGLMG